MNNTTHHTDDLGYKKGLEAAIAALRVQQETASVEANWNYEQIKGGTLTGEAYKYHRARFDFYNDKNDALVETIRGIKQQLKTI